MYRLVNGSQAPFSQDLTRPTICERISVMEEGTKLLTKTFIYLDTSLRTGKSSCSCLLEFRARVATRSQLSLHSLLNLANPIVTWRYWIYSSVPTIKS